MSVPFWTSDPSILIQKDKLLEVWPSKDMDKNQSANSITRLIFLLTILGVIITRSAKLLVTGFITIAIMVFIHKNNVKKREGFATLNKNIVLDEVSKKYNLPTKANPLGNVLLTDIHDNPNRKPAPPAADKFIEQDINNNVKKMVADHHKIDGIDERLFRDLGDNYTFDLSMRNFYSTANTTIPNDQDGFAKFCYGDMVSCKEGSDLACIQKNFRHKGN